MRRLVPIVVVVLAGCGGSDPPRPEPSPAAPRVAAPDAGMPAGHDAEPLRVAVPPGDSSAPEAVLRLGSARAVSGGAAPDAVRLRSPVLRPSAVGRDKQGMGRIRVSLHAEVVCGGERVPLIRYFPPPEIARVRIAPGTVTPTLLERRVRFGLRCPGGAPAAASGTLWADATSAWETEASSAPIRFTYP
jgi:hypothetical protein